MTMRRLRQLDCPQRTYCPRRYLVHRQRTENCRPKCQRNQHPPGTKLDHRLERRVLGSTLWQRILYILHRLHTLCISRRLRLLWM